MSEQASILIIEDEPRLRKNLQVLLQSEGYRVVTAPNGAEGIEQIKRESFDLVLTDVVMPEVDGFQVMAYLKAHAPETVTVVVTGYVSSESILEAMRNGAYDYITKPFDYDLMMITLDRALEKAGLQKALQCYMSDLEHKVAERTSKLTETNRKLAQSLDDLKEAQEHVIRSEKLSALGELIAGAAHELNNPLTTIIGNAELLAHTMPPGTKTGDQTRRIHDAAARCAQIVKNLLSFARRQKTEETYLDINALCDKTLQLLAYQFKVDNIMLETRFDDKLPKTMADPHQLQQVLVNLGTNAHQAMASSQGSGKLVVETTQRHGVIQIAFRDNGPGISKEHQRKVFDPFFTTKEQGTGLGLSLAYGIIKAHGGQLSVQSTPGEGATFVIELPIIESEQPAQEPAILKPPPWAQKRVLVVDDEESNLDLLLEVVGLLGHQVEGASSGQEAIEKLAKHDYDMLITDLRMPNIDGRRLYYHVKTAWPELAERIVFTSGDTVSEDTRLFLEGAGRPFLMKPFGTADVEALFRRPAMLPSHAA